MAATTWTAGTELPALAKEITGEQIADFEACSAGIMDSEVRRNIHTDADLAKKVGLDAPVASGMITTAYITELLTRSFGASWIDGGHLAVAFLKPIRAGEKAIVKGQIREVAENADGAVVHIDVWCENGDGVKVTAGSADLAL